MPESDKKEQIMAEKLKIISLGGLNEVGKNITVFEYKNDILVVDCGIGFPDGEMYGVDVVIPNVAYLAKSPQMHVRFRFCQPLAGCRTAFETVHNFLLPAFRAMLFPQNRNIH